MLNRNFYVNVIASTKTLLTLTEVKLQGMQYLARVLKQRMNKQL